MPKHWKTEKPLPPAPETDPYASELFAAEIGGVPGTDLHGLRPDEARMEVERFVNASFLAGERAVRVIHGRGVGALRMSTRKILEEYQQKGIVAAFRDSLQPGSLGGVTVVALHAKE